ncbi:hypothetical protein ACFC0M_21985 [Streptomyces sp. NPDC056149]|uniref:hypothetical protein n=1 Tax=unclassified Streptomyces TaxID=2593676 RepID=UPI0023818413|nr:hypothetical protein [Streptomyces sp. WZ-12]
MRHPERIIGSGIDDPDFADSPSRLIGDPDVETTPTSHSESGKSTSVSMRQGGSSGAYAGLREALSALWVVCWSTVCRARS